MVSTDCFSAEANHGHLRRPMADRGCPKLNMQAKRRLRDTKAEAGDFTLAHGCKHVCSRTAEIEPKRGKRRQRDVL